MLADGKRADPRNIRALVLAPTRELVNQIAANLKTFVKKSPLRVGLVVGGASINKQSEQLGRGVEISYDAVLADVHARDARDTGRADAPLLRAPDAMLLDNTDMDKNNTS